MKQSFKKCFAYYLGKPRAMKRLQRFGYDRAGSWSWTGLLLYLYSPNVFSRTIKVRHLDVRVPTYSSCMASRYQDSTRTNRFTCRGHTSFPFETDFALGTGCTKTYPTKVETLQEVFSWKIGACFVVRIRSCANMGLVTFFSLSIL